MTDFVYFWVATFINVSWVAGHNVRPGSAVYATTRAAVRMLSEGQRQEAKVLPRNLYQKHTSQRGQKNFFCAKSMS